MNAKKNKTKLKPIYVQRSRPSRIRWSSLRFRLKKSLSRSKRLLRAESARLRRKRRRLNSTRPPWDTTSPWRRPSGTWSKSSCRTISNNWTRKLIACRKRLKLYWEKTKNWERAIVPSTSSHSTFRHQRLVAQLCWEALFPRWIWSSP